MTLRASAAVFWTKQTPWPEQAVPAPFFGQSTRGAGLGVGVGVGFGVGVGVGAFVLQSAPRHSASHRQAPWNTEPASAVAFMPKSHVPCPEHIVGEPGQSIFGTTVVVVVVVVVVGVGVGVGLGVGGSLTVQTLPSHPALHLQEPWNTPTASAAVPALMTQAPLLLHMLPLA
jgi:hypothetical protein